MRHFVPKIMLKTYFNANIKPIIQNGLLFKGCVNLSTLDPLFMAQRKVLPMINSKGKFDSVSGDFLKNKILVVYELYVYV